MGVGAAAECTTHSGSARHRHRARRGTYGRARDRQHRGRAADRTDPRPRRFPQLTAEQARNAITIAQVARDLQVPRYGLQIAIATAIQESKLVNLTGGDRDSGGLFQQRPSTGWGTRAQVTNPALAPQAFFGEAQHTDNPGPARHPRLGADAAHPGRPGRAAVSGFPDAYAQWEAVAGDITDLLGGDLPDVDGTAMTRPRPATSAAPEGDTVDPITVGTFNMLGAGHTDGKAGGGKEQGGFATWEKRLPGAIDALENAGVTIAGLQEVHGPAGQGPGRPVRPSGACTRPRERPRTRSSGTATAGR